MSSQAPTGNPRWNAAVSRGLLFLIFWLALSRGNPDDLLAGMVTTIVATWASLHLLPPRSSRFSLVALMTFALRFLYSTGCSRYRCRVACARSTPALANRILAYQPRLPLGPERYALPHSGEPVLRHVAGRHGSRWRAHHSLSRREPTGARVNWQRTKLLFRAHWERSRIHG